MDERATSASGWPAGTWGVVARLVEVDGSAAHPWFRHLSGADGIGGTHQRDLADAIHALCTLYGHQPGIADEALGHRALPAAADWLADAAQAFAAERGYLAQLTAAAGPLPSTSGQAESHAAITGQAHALSMLARSDRGGCALGAVAALVADWTAIRRILDLAAARFGVPPSDAALPDLAETANVVAGLASTPSTERAIAFGAQQLLAQHRGLWSLMEARASARLG